MAVSMWLNLPEFPFPQPQNGDSVEGSLSRPSEDLGYCLTHQQVPSTHCFW